MPDPVFEINAPGVDTQELVANIRATVADKLQRGCYNDPLVARAERANLANLRNEDDFLPFYLECLGDAVFVDIGDFEIVERRASFSTALIAIKRLIWKLLKFYTYRLWSQQNQVNGLLLSALEATESRFSERTKALEERLAALEGEAPAPGTSKSGA